jgi:hypothetical protein
MMKDNTPYRERPISEIEKEQVCMRSVFGTAPPVTFIYEAFGGIGKTAHIMAERFPKAKVLSSETDEECVRLYNDSRTTKRIECKHMDAQSMLAAIRKLPQNWGASLDFNRLTLLDLEGRKEGQWKIDLIAAVVARNPSWIQVTDSAIRYLHLNYEKYKCPNTAKAYQTKMGKTFQKRWGYGLAATSHYYAASYLLLTR